MYAFGVDIGGTSVKIGLVDEKGKILGKRSAMTGMGRPFRDVMLDTAKLIAELEEEAGVDPEEICGICVDVPGLVDQEKGTLAVAVNMSGEGDMSIRDPLQEATGLPVFMGNDASVAALGEAVYGAGQGKVSSAVLVTLGTGVGVGLIINGRVFAGSQQGGSEGGHIVIVKDGLPCNCGRKGCWESYSSVTALLRMAREEAQKDPDSILWKLCDGDLSKLNGKMVGDAEDAGDKATLRVMKKYIEYLAVGVGNLINILDPDMVMIGGGFSARGDKLLLPLMDVLKKEVYNEDLSHTEVRIAQLGNDAGILGGAAMVFTETGRLA